MIPPVDYTYEEFPESSIVADGMKVIKYEEDVTSVECEKYINYVQRDGKALKLQFLMPKHTVEHDEKLPCIVFVQGSGWIKQQLYINLGNLSKVAAKGYVVAVVQHRSSEEAPFPAQVEDVKTAIRFLRKNAEKYKIDKDNIFLWGDSSGGHVALISAMTGSTGEFDTDDYSEYSSEVNGIIDFYAPTDITKMNEAPTTADYTIPESPVGMLIGKLDVVKNPEIAQRANVLNYVCKQAKIPSVLIFHGTKDRIVPFKQSVMLYEKLLHEGKETSIYKVIGQDHCGPGFWQDEIIEIIDDFIKQHIKQLILADV